MHFLTLLNVLPALTTPIPLSHSTTSWVLKGEVLPVERTVLSSSLQVMRRP